MRCKLSPRGSQSVFRHDNTSRSSTWSHSRCRSSGPDLRKRWATRVSATTTAEESPECRGRIMFWMSHIAVGTDGSLEKVWGSGVPTGPLVPVHPRLSHRPLFSFSLHRLAIGFLHLSQSRDGRERKPSLRGLRACPIRSARKLVLT